MGAFADAHFRVFGNTEESRRTMRALLAPLRAHVREAGLGFVSEMFDGDSAPRAARLLRPGVERRRKSRGSVHALRGRGIGGRPCAS